MALLPEQRGGRVQFVAIFASLLLVFTSSSLFPASSASPSSASDYGCMAAIASADKGVSIPVRQAVAMAESSAQFSEKSQGFASVWFATTNDQWSYTRDCSTALDGVNVIFGLNNTIGLRFWLVVDETANISKVTEAYVAPVGRLQTYSRWSGYELWGNQGKTAPVLESEISFNQPKPIYPSQCGNSGSTCVCGDYGTCEIAVWAGLSNSLGASSGQLAQTGTVAWIQCQVGCGYTYEGVYELLPNPAVPCSPSGGISNGDGIVARVTNHYANGGNIYYYDFIIDDFKTNQACTANNNYYTMVPYFSEQIFEWPMYCNNQGSCVSLAGFSDTSAYGATWYNGAFVSDYAAYSKGYYLLDDLTWYCSYWGQSTDVATGLMGSGSQWAESYVTSACT
jgi:hypothetical protein